MSTDDPSAFDPWRCPACDHSATSSTQLKKHVRTTHGVKSVDQLREKDVQGPNIKKLIVAKISKDACPAGASLADVFDFLSGKGKVSLSKAAKEATEWVNSAILAVRCTPGENPWRRSSDEEIAGEILKKMEEKK